MTITVLTIGPDGTQTAEQREVADGYIKEPEAPAEAATDPQADTDAMLVDHEYRIVMLELGITE